MVGFALEGEGRPSKSKEVELSSVSMDWPYFCKNEERGLDNYNQNEVNQLNQTKGNGSIVHILC